MGGLVGGLFDLFSGNPAAGEESELGTVGNEEIGTGENLVTPAATYYEELLSNNPTEEAQALAPEIQAGQNQVEQQKLTDADFGTRSGGSTAANAAAEGQERGNIISLLGEQKAGAAGAAGSLGSEQENAGTSNVNTEANMAVQNRQRQVNDINGVAQGVASIAEPFLEGAGGGGGGSTPGTPMNSGSIIPDPFEGLGSEPAPISPAESEENLGGEPDWENINWS